MERFDLISPRQSNDKTYWHKVGAAFPRDKGGFSLVFDSLPLPDKDGKVSLLMVPPKPKNITTEQFKEVQNVASGEVPLDDNIPF